MILALNTAQAQHEMALLDGDRILVERQWQGSRDDVSRLVPTLDEMLQELEVDKSEIKDIAVVHGPGPYTAVRMGVAFANALAAGLKAQLHSISTFDLLRKKVATTDPVIVVLFAGGLNVAVDHEAEVQLGALSSLLAPHKHHEYKVVAELPDPLRKELHSICLEKDWEQVQGQQLSSFAESILTEGWEGFEAVDQVEEQYLRDPKITPSSNPWKKA